MWDIIVMQWNYYWVHERFIIAAFWIYFTHYIYCAEFECKDFWWRCNYTLKCAINKYGLFVRLKNNNNVINDVINDDNINNNVINNNDINNNVINDDGINNYVINDEMLSIIMLSMTLLIILTT